MESCGCGFAFAVGCIVGAVAIFMTLLFMPEPPDE
jgi:hypothetical protein